MKKLITLVTVLVFTLSLVGSAYAMTCPLAACGKEMTPQCANRWYADTEYYQCSVRPNCQWRNVIYHTLNVCSCGKVQMQNIHRHSTEHVTCGGSLAGCLTY